MGACVQEDSCECTDSSGREWQSGAQWTVRSHNFCESCICSTAGIVNCKKTSCAEFDDCTYTDWSDWSSCNSSCVAEESRQGLNVFILPLFYFMENFDLKIFLFVSFKSAEEAGKNTTKFFFFFK